MPAAAAKAQAGNATAANTRKNVRPTDGPLIRSNERLSNDSDPN